MRCLAVVCLFLLLCVPCAGAWTWPVQGPVIAPFSFDAAHPYAGGEHRGIDIGAAAGADVAAPVSGTVTFAGSVPSSGRTVSILTGDALSVTLTHLGSVSVAKGAQVDEGTTVGTVGPSGTPELEVPYVHLGVRTAADDNGYLDPLSLLPAVASPPPAVVVPPAPVQPAAAVEAGPVQPEPEPAQPQPVQAIQPAQPAADPTPAPVAPVAAPADPAPAPADPVPAGVPAGPPAPAASAAVAAPAIPDAVPVNGPAAPADPEPDAVPPAPIEAAAVASVPAGAVFAGAPPAAVVAPPAFDPAAPSVVPDRLSLGERAGPVAARTPAVVRVAVPAATVRPVAPIRSRRTFAKKRVAHVVHAQARRLRALPPLRPADGGKQAVSRNSLLLLLLAALAAVATVTATAITVRMIPSPRPRREGASTAGEDPRRTGVAVCERPASYRPRGRLRRARRRVRPLSPAQGRRGADGERDGRAWDARHGVGGSKRRVAA